MLARLTTCGARGTNRVRLLSLLGISFGLLLGHHGPAAADAPFCVRFGDTDAPPVDLFLALQQQRVQAQVVVRDPFHARLMLSNPSLLPIALQIPDVVGARPILAQQGLNFPFGGPSKPSSNAQAPQPVGGTTSPFGLNRQQGANGGGPGQGANFFNVAPEKVATLEIRCVCLQQGAPNPRSVVSYQLVPLAELNADPRLPELLRSYGRGEVERDVAQAAAWHIVDRLDWKTLADLSQMIAINAERPLFNAVQLRKARAAVEAAEQAAAARRTANRRPVVTVEGQTLPLNAVQQPAFEGATFDGRTTKAATKRNRPSRP
jgi:hypothetical protein